MTTLPSFASVSWATLRALHALTGPGHRLQADQKEQDTIPILVYNDLKMLEDKIKELELSLQCFLMEKQSSELLSRNE